ncbi:MAG: hypothetical protein WBI20_11055 [Burkholderiaceae bacterium]
MEALTEPRPETPPANFTLYDGIFLVFLVLVFVLVTWLGVHTRQEALKTEATKGNGEAWVAWFKQASEKRFDANYAYAACVGGAQADSAKPSPVLEAVVASSETKAEDAIKPTSVSPATGTWGACLAELLKKSSLKDLRNPFNGEAPKYVEACVPGDLSLIGGIDIDKSIATPAGSAIPFVKSNLAPTDSIKEKQLLTVTVCDKGGYPIKIAEIEF